MFYVESQSFYREEKFSKFIFCKDKLKVPNNIIQLGAIIKLSAAQLSKE